MKTLLIALALSTIINTAKADVVIYFRNDVVQKETMFSGKIEKVSYINDFTNKRQVRVRVTKETDVFGIGIAFTEQDVVIGSSLFASIGKSIEVFKDSEGVISYTVLEKSSP